MGEEYVKDQVWPMLATLNDSVCVLACALQVSLWSTFMSIKTLIDNVAELNKAIDTWGRQGQKWAKDGHMLAMSALTILGTSGDVGPVNRLYLAMPKGTKSSAMAEWMLTFGKLVPTEGDNSKTKPFSYAKDKAMDLAGAEKKPWYEFKPEPTVLECFDVTVALRQFLKTATDKAAKAQTSIDVGLLEQIKTLLPDEATEEGQDDAGDPLAARHLSGEQAGAVLAH